MSVQCYVVFTLSVITLFFETTYIEISCPENKYGRSCRLHCNCIDKTNCFKNRNSTSYCQKCSPGFSSPNQCQRQNAALYTNVRTEHQNAKTSFLVDGKISSCTTLGTWFEIDLGQIYDIKNFYIFRNPGAMVCFVIYVTSSPTINGEHLLNGYCQTVATTENGDLECEHLLTGRYIFGKTPLSQFTLCTVSVYVCADYTYGTLCDKHCSCLDPFEVCNKTTGACPSGCYMTNPARGCPTGSSAVATPTTTTTIMPTTTSRIQTTFTTTRPQITTTPTTRKLISKTASKHNGKTRITQDTINYKVSTTHLAPSSKIPEQKLDNKSPQGSVATPYALPNYGWALICLTIALVTGVVGFFLGIKFLQKRLEKKETHVRRPPPHDDTYLVPLPSVKPPAPPQTNLEMQDGTYYSPVGDRTELANTTYPSPLTKKRQENQNTYEGVSFEKDNSNYIAFPTPYEELTPNKQRKTNAVYENMQR